MKSTGIVTAFLLNSLCLLVVHTENAQKEGLEASFYGDSFAHSAFQDANQDISINLEFRTVGSEGLLLYAAGGTDYMLVQLNAGIIEARVNLGSGEAVAFSVRKVRLDDGLWHEIKITCMKGLLYLEVDGMGQDQLTTPGSFYALNIEFGVYLGGIGNPQHKFLNEKMRPFRGCLRKVVFNERNILNNIKGSKDAQSAFRVSWYCDSEFTAESGSEISLSHKTSFVAFPSFKGSDGVFSCDFKTKSPDAILLFNSGMGSTLKDFIAITLVDGKPKFLVNRGNGVTEVSLQNSVSDGKWHSVKVSISESSVAIQVDLEQNHTRFYLGGQSSLNLGSYLYMGGVDTEARSQIIQLGWLSASNASLVGCIRNIFVNSVMVSLQHVLVSRFIDVGCEWNFPCSQNPCIATAKCVDVGKREFKCECDQSSCVRNTSQQHTKDLPQLISSILSVRDIVVPKGDFKIINSNNIQVQDIYRDYFRQNNVVFLVKDAPQRGIVEIRDGTGNQNSFTWNDLRKNLVLYRHFGDSLTLDRIVLEVNLPPLQNGAINSYEFVLPVQIISRDHLQVKTPNGHVLGISPGGKMHITTAVLNVKSDTDAFLISFEVTYLHQTASYFELATVPDEPITSFTLFDIQMGHVWFQHKGDVMVYSNIRVTDVSKHLNDIVQLHFRKKDLEINMLNNTGIYMGYGSTHVITSQNLSFLAGSEFEELEVLYQVIQSPKHGVLQLHLKDSDWIDVQNFTQQNIDSNKVRYQHFPDDTYSNFDSFKFQVSSKSIQTQSQTFSIRFKAVILSIESNNNLVIHEHSYKNFSNKTLLVLCNIDNLDFHNIVYSVIRAPSKGRLYLAKHFITRSVDFDLLPPLKIDETFSQMDINRGLVYYKYNYPSIRKDSDYADLQASYFGYTIMVRVIIQYSPGNVGVQLINKGLKGVLEGSMKALSKQNLFIETDQYKNFTFSIIKNPSHGSLKLIDPKTSIVLQSEISSFITSQVVSGKVAYHHDDSEHDKDYFEFSVSPNVRETILELPEEIKDLIGTFPISIIMRNDNPPVRVSSKVFHVVTGQIKTITTQDLSFHDPDIDFDDSLLFYQRQKIPNGDILDKISEEEVFNFTQKDLMDGRLIFNHRGENFSRVPILVSDGQFFSNSIFEIQASKPFFNVIGNLHLEVENGQRATLNQDIIGIESNLDFKPEDGLFQLANVPKFGNLQVNGISNADFSFSDILKGIVKYHHWGKSSLTDVIDFIVTLKTFTTYAQVSIDIISFDTSGPPEIIHNQILTVNINQVQVITEQYLKVRHHGYLPGEINYIITGLPRHGHLIIGGRVIRAGSAPEFSQEDINNGHIVYASDTALHLTDKFTFDVGTETESLRNMEFLIETVPETIMVTHINVTVREGGRFIFNLSMFTQYKLMSASGPVFFNVDQAPMHGKLVLQIRDQNSQIRSFSSEDLLRKRVSYIHDDSESQNDMITIKADPQKSGMHPGEVLMVMITVEPVDDQPPRIVVNSGLNLWSGSLALLTRRQLQAVDLDSLSADIHYLVTVQPSNGHLAFLNNTFKPINSFTQLDLDSGDLVFAHKGAEYGSFRVKVIDTKNYGGSATVRVRARPVSITMANMRLIHAFPYSVQPITKQFLMAEVSASNFSHPIIFTLKNPRPLNGRLITRIGEQIEEIKSFTQDEVDQGKIYYQHTSTMLHWKETDRLFFDISTTYAEILRDQILSIDIAFSNINLDNYQELLKIKTKSVIEGEKVFISKDNFDSNWFAETIQNFKPDVTIFFSFESFAQHGQLLYKDQIFELGQEFTQDDLDSHLLVYKHDHSNTVTDQFLFGVKILVPRSHSEPELSVAGLNFNFSLVIEPINDGAFELVTRHPKISVLQGSEVVITPHNLTTLDLDTGPDGLEYVIITQPDNGMLVLDSAPQTPLWTFTQLDINKLGVIFKHDKSTKSSSSVYFKVSDKKHTPTYANLDILVQALYIEVKGDVFIPVLQGSPSVTLTPNHLNLQTNGDLSKVEYTILQETEFGRLIKQGKSALYFSQRDLEEGNIQYIQSPDSQGKDSFLMSVSLSDIQVVNRHILCRLVQKPLVRQGPLVAVDNSYVAITKASLDVSELAKLTNDDPQFRISNAPSHGNIMIRRRQRRQAGAESSFKTVSEFTFEDILFTRIYYVPHKKKNSASQDKFTYILSAKGVPPAKGELTIDLEEDLSSSGKIPQGSVTDPPLKNNGIIDGGSPDDGSTKSNSIVGNGEVNGLDEKEASLDPSLQEESDGDSDSFMIIIIVVVVVFLLLLAIFMTIFIWRKRQAKQRAAKELKLAAKPRPLISGPLQLEQPHMLMQSKSGNTNGNGDNENTEIPLLSSPADSHGAEAIAFISTSFSHGDGKSVAKKDGLYVNTAHIQEQQQQMSSQNNVSPDVTIVPTARLESEPSISEGTSERHSTITSGRGSSASGDLIEWTLTDPDLLQSCNLSTPALRHNQYWL
ncbi:chondroitin sulfate proteoglycan 4-like [Plakobranchus ocellatus]|uniref:Chondroitin sulfate proteoglycan 4-like n=1 Tax=Plakobranchus ocellatus TaxID=259542 RepID=A0AAV4ALJ5_9GAST|nr:chondroitin sulfate proteoglycan 4-like [Plakobranchus ocellatus]